MTMQTNTTATKTNRFEVITGKIKTPGSRTATRIAYERKSPSVRRSFFPAAPFDAQSLAGTGALVFEGEMIGGGN